MSAPLIFIAETLFELYVLCFVLRFVLQATRADFHNPLSQLIVRVTNPVVLPLRRLVSRRFGGRGRSGVGLLWVR